MRLSRSKGLLNSHGVDKPGNSRRGPRSRRSWKGEGHLTGQQTGTLEDQEWWSQDWILESDCLGSGLASTAPQQRPWPNHVACLSLSVVLCKMGFYIPHPHLLLRSPGDHQLTKPTHRIIEMVKEERVHGEFAGPCQCSVNGGQYSYFRGLGATQ